VIAGNKHRVCVQSSNSWTGSFRSYCLSFCGSQYVGSQVPPSYDLRLQVGTHYTFSAVAKVGGRKMVVF